MIPNEARGVRAFGGYDVRLDPWDADYGSELPIDSDDEADAAEVDTAVEVGGSWAPLTPTRAGASDPLVFVDGVRRVDARVLLQRGPGEVFDSLYGEPVRRPIHGAFGAYAVGTVVVSGGRAAWGAMEIQRLFCTGGDVRLPAREARVGLDYANASAEEGDADAPLRAIQRAMRACEERVARASAGLGALVVADGPLSFGGAGDHRPTAGGRVVGFVKRLYKLYVGDRVAALPALSVGTRSPLFAIRAPAGFSRWSWFVRLSEPGRGDSSFAGLARLEIDAVTPLDEARAIADESATRLPRFAPSRARDPRSPQNLLPIGALEARLRRLLGDRRLVRRRLGAWLASEAA
ncbi:MAG: hypothetical protein U0414_09735 [Polyangiaceae bacterium]